MPAAACAAVMKPASAIAARTVCARCSAPSGLRFGASRDGDLTRPASIAASAMVTLRGRLDAIGAGAEIDAVQVKLKNFRLGVFAFEPDRKFRFLQFTLNRALLR